MATRSAHHPSRSVLLVEDDRDLRELLTQALRVHGFAVTAVGNGREALDYLRDAEPPALILLDLMMPVVDGFGFLRQQRADPDLSQIPVAVLTALDQVHTPGLDGVTLLSKPLDFDRLLALVRLHCRP